MIVAFSMIYFHSISDNLHEQFVTLKNKWVFKIALKSIIENLFEFIFNLIK